MTCGQEHASYSLPEWQAVKLTFFAPCIAMRITFEATECCVVYITWQEIISQKLNSLQSYKGVLVLPWYNFHSCNLILVHPVMLVTWRDCGQLQKHFMQEELFYLRVDNTVHVHDWRLIINVAKRNRNGEILTTGCEVRKNEGSPAVWTCEIQSTQNTISTKKHVRCQGPWPG